MKAKRLLAIVLVLVLAVALSVSAFAAGSGSITINNATVGKTYKLYKVFDATYTNGATAYTYDGSNNTFLTALKAADSPFTVTQNTSGTYNVEAKSTATGATIATFLTANVSCFGNAVKSTDATTTTVSWTGLDYAYYYITSSLGTAVTVTTANPSPTVQDKNQDPGPNGDNYKNVSGSDSFNYGDTVSWTISAKATNYDGETKVTYYKATDVLGTGFDWDSFKIDSVVVGDATLTVGSDYTVSSDATTRTTTVNVPWVNATTGDSLYAATTTLTINCSATANDSGANYTNTGDIVWDGEEPHNDPPVEVYTYDVTVDKYDSADTTKATKLSGAKFVLYKEVGEAKTKQYYKYADEKVTWVTDINSASEYTTDSNGACKFEGIAAGTYYLAETEAPSGYKIMTSAKTVTITDADATAEVANGKGAQLPSTGGTGTTLLIVLGSVLFVSMAVVLVTKKRMYNEG